MDGLLSPGGAVRSSKRAIFGLHTVMEVVANQVGMVGAEKSFAGRARYDRWAQSFRKLRMQQSPCLS